MNDILNRLYATIESRKTVAPEKSCTATLFAAGENEIVRKLGEQVIEVIVAAKGEGEDRIVHEMADLIYHAMVLLAARGIEWRRIDDELVRRFAG